MKKVIWTPHFGRGCDFGIYLDFDFAKKMFEYKANPKLQDRINELGNDELEKRKFNWKNPFTFYEDTYMISQIYLGQNGLWLATDITSLEMLAKDKKYDDIIKFYSHNADFPSQTFVLMRLFHMWYEYGAALNYESHY